MSNFHEQNVPVSGKEDLEFEGKLVASGKGYFTDDYGKSREEALELYQTKGGNFVAARSVDYGDISEDTAEVFEGKEQLLESITDFFGHTDAAKSVYSEANGKGLDIKSTRRIS